MRDSRVEEASLRAFKFFAGFRGENTRAWLLTIVRNTFYNWLRKNRPLLLIDIAVHRDGLYTHLFAGADDAQRDFSSICN